MKKIILRIEGMSCNGCVKAVERIIHKNDADAKATIHLANGRVEFESLLDPMIFVSALTTAGYPAHLL